MLTIHHLEDSRSQRILWLAEELGLEYDVIRYDRDPKTQLAPQALKDKHPLGTAPLIEDDDITLTESGAIIEYLLAKYGADKALKPTDPLSQAGRDYQFWMHFAEGSVMPMLVLAKVFMTIKNTRMPFFAKFIIKKVSSRVEGDYILPGIHKSLGFINAHLDSQDWFAGDDLSGADIQMSFPLEAAASMPELMRDYPNVLAWLERIHGRAAYQTALKRGGPYSFVG